LRLICCQLAAFGLRLHFDNAANPSVDHRAGGGPAATYFFLFRQKEVCKKKANAVWQ
jgi:hypothetical protein